MAARQLNPLTALVLFRQLGNQRSCIHDALSKGERRKVKDGRRKVTIDRLTKASALALALGIASPAAAEDLVFYEASHASLGDPFWAVYMKGLEDGAKRYGVELVSLASGSYEGIARQIEKTNQAIAANPDGLIVTIYDQNALDEVLRRAIDRGIPVIAVNVPDTRPETERIPYLFYVGGDEELGGRKAAQRVLRENAPSRAACVIHQAGHQGLTARCKGWSDVMAEASVETDIIAVPTSQPTQQAEQLRGYLRSHADTDAMFTVGPPPTSVALQVLEEMGKSNEVALMAYDLTTELIDAIKAGTLLGTIDQQQYLQGYLAVEFLYFHKTRGFTLGGPVLTGPAVIDSSNADLVAENVAAGYR